MRIACVLAKDFEDSEFQIPYDAFEGAGHSVTVIGARAGESLDGKKGKATARVDLAIDEARPDAFDALFIPGGKSPAQLREDPRFVRFAAAFAKKPIFAVCHGPQLLIAADMVRGRTLTGWPSVQTELSQAGAKAVDREVVVDGNIVTSRKPEDLPAFVRQSLAALGPAKPSASAS
ncbi:MAG: type 1 glutamine amidotransferase domain-containing protein [Myxococcota bacterium]